MNDSIQAEELHEKAINALTYLTSEEGEDYARCASECRSILEAHEKAGKHASDPDHVIPYLSYLKLFAEAYRTWQISYQYTTIRSQFRLAHIVFEQQLRAAVGGDHLGSHGRFSDVLRFLSEALCSYTHCENAYISNDPVSLERHTIDATGSDRAALDRLTECSPEGRFHAALKRWLSDYLDRNVLMDEGLHQCAIAYRHILLDRPYDKLAVLRELARAREAYDQISDLSPELSSEVRAHIKHIELHAHRLTDEENPVTFLRVRQGNLVLSLSAACKVDDLKELLKDKKQANAKIKKAFEKCGIVPSDLRQTQLHDIFETSFGVDFLSSSEFDLPKIRVRMLEGEEYEFKVMMSLSELGVCTVYFTHYVDQSDKVLVEDGSGRRLSDNEWRKGLTVERTRMLQTLICPHTGQVELEFEQQRQERTNKKAAPEFADFLSGEELIQYGFSERIDLDGFSVILERLSKWLFAPDRTRRFTMVEEATTRCLGILAEARKDLLMGERHDPSGPPLQDWQALLTAVCELCTVLKPRKPDASVDPGDSEYLRSVHADIVELFNKMRYLQDVASVYLECMHAIIQGQTPETTDSPLCSRDADEMLRDPAWVYMPDTGWHAYLCATKIDEVNLDGSVRRAGVGFDDIGHHPDINGFLIEQRETRASFDDWRFAGIQPDIGRNLALIRSHQTDAFFGSEYHAFLFFPDDPMYLIAQYEATVDLMIRLDTALKYFRRQAQDMSRDVRSMLAPKRHRDTAPGDHAPGSTKDGDGEAYRDDIDELRRSLEDARMLRWEAREIRHLTASAATSRYKDHGDLMTAIMERMKLDKVVATLDDHLSNLSELQTSILERIEGVRAKERARKERNLRIGIFVLTSFTAAAALSSVTEAIFKIKGVEDSVASFLCIDRDSIMPIATLTLIAIVLVALFILYRNVSRGSADDLEVEG